MKKHIALIYGGCGHEHEVSVAGHRCIRSLLSPEKYRVTDIFIDKCGDFYIENPDGEKYPAFPSRIMGRSGFLSGGRLITPDVVFPLLHGDFGEDGRIQGLFECAGLPYVGEGVGVGALTADKGYTKAVAERLGIPVSPYITLRGGTLPEEAEKRARTALSYPMFLKPTGLGSSVGARAVFAPDEFLSAYGQAAALGDVMAERLITNKRELECSFLYYMGEKIITPPGEILCPGTYGYHEKYRCGTKTVTRADIPTNVADTLRTYARLLIDEIGIRSLSRIDFFLTDGGIVFNEINTLPGFTRDSMYLKMLAASGISEGCAIDALIERASELG